MTRNLGSHTPTFAMWYLGRSDGGDKTRYSSSGLVSPNTASSIADIRALPGGIAKTTRWYLDRYSDPVAREHMADGLRKAGLLEQ
jgi:hypothetical protein